MLACSAPLTRRTAISIHNAVAIAVTKKLSASPLKPISSTGRRPKRSDSAPRIGEPMKLAKPKAIATQAYAPTCSAGVASKLPTSLGSTGMISPIEIMSISTVAMMNGIAAWRLPEAAVDSATGDWSAFTLSCRVRFVSCRPSLRSIFEWV